ncbi:MAG TPA: 3-oxo-tetronate kinase [Acidobacteriaceae bacterium]|jgi:uncharacterized protein YgbK (DUF1537 family)|nr:3-oxo-tetronate kinase [Acidobacteriaceae bacterium]
MAAPRIGCIADDFTGATDVANNLARAGMRTSLAIGELDADVAEADAVVVALKSRTIPAEEAVQQSVAVCRALRRAGVAQIYFKICSTFDSTAEGNIGPVIEALMQELGCAFSVVAPGFPENGRTVYSGHLFVGDVLLSESSMRFHPLTPMTDSDLRTVLGRQFRRFRDRPVGLIRHKLLSEGAERIRGEMAAMQASGIHVAIADTLDANDLEQLAGVLQEAAFVTGSAGLAEHLPGQWGFAPGAETTRLPQAKGRAAILSGSCSEATNRQVRHFLESGGAAAKVDPWTAAERRAEVVAELLAWARQEWQTNPDQPLLIYSTEEGGGAARPEGMPRMGEAVEEAMGELAAGLVGLGVRRLIVAGGETSGACVRSLGIRTLRIGPQIDPGVPWCFAESAKDVPEGMHVALKSGNFGATDFFSKALGTLRGDQKQEEMG